MSDNICMYLPKAPLEEGFGYALKGAVLRVLGEKWTVTKNKLTSDWSVRVKNYFDVGFVVSLRHTRVAFEKRDNRFEDWAQGCVTEELSDFFGVEVHHEHTGYTGYPGTFEYRRGKTFKEYLERDFFKPLKAEDEKWVETFRSEVPQELW